MNEWWAADPIASDPQSSDWWRADPVVAAAADEPLRVTITPKSDGAPPPASSSIASDRLNAFAGNVLDGIPVAGPYIKVGADRLKAGLQSLTGDETFDQELAAVQARSARTGEEHPVSATSGSIVGGVLGTAPLVAAAPGLMGVQGASLGGRAVMGALSGAGLGGSDAAVRSGGDPFAAAVGVGAGAVLGGAAPKVGQLIGKAAQTAAESYAKRGILNAIEGAPSTAFLKELSSDLYREARQAGVTVRADAFQDFARGLQATLSKAGANSTIHPKTAGFVGEVVDRLGKPQNLDGLEALRHLAGDVAAAPDPAERRLGSIVLDQVDEWIEGLPRSAVEGGDPRTAVLAWRDARELWGRARRSEVLEKIVRDAEQSASGVEAGIRNGFRALSKNDKALRGFSDIEKTMIRAVAKGTPLEQGLRLVGKAAPTGVVSATLSAMLGSMAGGALGAGVALGGGYLAKKGADAMTRAAADRASSVVRIGRRSQRALPKPKPVNQKQIDRQVQIGALGALLPLISR